MTTPQVRVAIYARVSRDKTGEAASVTAQLAECRDLCEAEGFDVVEEFRDDSVSAYDGSQRPDYDRLISLVRSGQVGAVVAWHPDRVHRSTVEAVEFVKVCREAGVRHLHTVAAGSFDLRTAFGEKALVNATVDARYESAHRGERVQLARKRQARQGISGGSRPFGYGLETYQRRIYDRKTGEYIVKPTAEPVRDYSRAVPEEAEAVREWARQLLAGVSLRQVAAFANGPGQPPPVQGKRWIPTRIRQIVTSRRMTGASVHHGEVVNAEAYEQILTPDTRDALESLFADPSRRTSPGSTPRWLGSLIYECGKCADGTVHFVRWDPNKRERVYACRAKSHARRPVAELDAYVSRVIVERLSRPDAALLISTSSNGIDRAALGQERAVLVESIDAMMGQFAGKYARQAAARRIEEAERRIDEIDATLAEDARTSPLAGLAGRADVAERWEGLPIGVRRAVLRELCTVTVLPASRGPRPADWTDHVADWVRIEPRQAS